MESETVTQNALAAALAEYDIIVSSLGLLRAVVRSAGPNGGLQVLLRGIGNDGRIDVMRRERGWEIDIEEAATLSPDQRAEICGLVKEWARPRMQRFLDADRKDFFATIETTVKMIDDALGEIPCDPEDTDLIEMLDTDWMRFVSDSGASAIRRAVDMANEARARLSEAADLFRQAAAEGKA